MATLTQLSFTVDDLDLALISCLQADPRASWRRVAAALELDPVTVARRWQRLSDAGIAWVTGRPAVEPTPESCWAVVEVDCATTHSLEIGQRLAEWPSVLNIEQITGDRSLTLLVMVPDLAALTRLLLESLAAVPGMRATRSHLVTQVYAQGDHWRLGALDAAQQSRLLKGVTAPPRTPVGSRPLGPAERQLCLSLGTDGRMSIVDLAQAAGLNVSTARRRLRDLVARGQIQLRCDAALSLSGWPILMWVWGRIDADDHETLGILSRRIPGVRACLRISGGEPNLLLSLAAHSLHEVPSVEARLARDAPRLRVLDQSVVLHSVKRMGRILDAAGRSTRAVPIDIWASPTV